MAEANVRRHTIGTQGREGKYETADGRYIYFLGFTSKTKAKAFKRKRGGVLCYAEDSTGYSKDGNAYKHAVLFGGLDRNRFPCCVQWEEDRRGRPKG